MEFKPSLFPQESAENILKRNIESVENSKIDTISKLELILLLLGKKQGVHFGDFKIVESEKDTERTIEEFTDEMQEYLKLLKEINAYYVLGKELRFEGGMVGFSVLAAKDKKILERFVQADKEDDDKTFGSILGYPPTAIETYNTDKKFDPHEELSPEDLEKLEAEGIMPFLLFMPSREHWLEELEWARENRRLIKENAPKLYQELVDFKE